MSPGRGPPEVARERRGLRGAGPLPPRGPLRRRGRRRPGHGRRRGVSARSQRSSATRSRPSCAACAASTRRTSGDSTRTSRRRSSRCSDSSTTSGGGSTSSGVKNVPAHGRGLLVANHAGSLFPFDASMMTMAVMREHPLPRWPRFMVLDWAFVLPFLSAFMRRVGGVPASPHNATRCSSATSW